MQHRFVLVQQTEHYAEWECPVCHRHIRLGTDGSGLKVLNRGDQEINHGSASTFPGLNMAQTQVNPVSLH